MILMQNKLVKSSFSSSVGLGGVLCDAWSCASFSLTYLLKHLLQLLKLHETSVQTKATPIPGGVVL